MRPSLSFCEEDVEILSIKSIGLPSSSSTTADRDVLRGEALITLLGSTTNRPLMMRICWEAHQQGGGMG